MCNYTPRYRPAPRIGVVVMPSCHSVSSSRGLMRTRLIVGSTLITVHASGGDGSIALRIESLAKILVLRPLARGRSAFADGTAADHRFDAANACWRRCVRGGRRCPPAVLPTLNVCRFEDWLKRGQQVRWRARFHEVPITSGAHRANSLMREVRAGERDDWDRSGLIGGLQSTSDLPTRRYPADRDRGRPPQFASCAQWSVHRDPSGQ